MTSAYLKAARERHAAIKTQMETMVREAEQGEMPDDLLKRMHNLGDEAHKIRNTVTELEAQECREAAVSDLHARVFGGQDAVGLAGGSTAYAALGGGQEVPALMPAPDQVAELYRAATEGQTVHRVEVTHTRAVVTTTLTGLPASAGSTPPVIHEPRRIATAARIPVEQVLGVQPLSFAVFGAGTADVAAENAVKPEYSAVTAGTATPAVISTWTDISRQAIESLPSFQQRLVGRHASLIAAREDVLMCARVLAATGIQTYVAPSSAPYADSLLAAAALVLASPVGAAPDLAVINPADVVKVFGGAATGPNGETPESQMRLQVHGMQVYVSTAVAAGAAIVGAWSAGARFVLGMRPTVLVDSVSQLKKNLVTVLSEQAVTLAVDTPEAFVSVDLNGA